MEERIKIAQFYKNRPVGYHVDHIIPIAKGGKHRLDNLQYLTKEENLRKRDKLPTIYDEIEWLEIKNHGKSFFKNGTNK